MCQDSNFIYDFKNCDVADIYELYFEKHGESYTGLTLCWRNVWKKLLAQYISSLCPFVSCCTKRFWFVCLVYTCRWRPVKLTPVVECLAVELSLPVFMTLICRSWDSNTKPFAKRGSDRLRQHGGVKRTYKHVFL